METISTGSPRRPMSDWARRRRAAHEKRSLLIRIPVAMLGFALVAIGVILVIFPGPAFLVLPPGVALLALEFDWAVHLLTRVEDLAIQAREKADRASMTQRVGGALVTIAGLAVFVAALLYFGVF